MVTTENDAIKVANSILSINKSNKEIEKIKTVKDNNNIVAYYVIKYKNKGFALISGDKRFSPILGYSDESNFSFEKMPEQLKPIMDNFVKNVEFVRKNKMIANDTINERWDYVLQGIPSWLETGGGTPDEPTPVDPIEPGDEPHTPILYDITYNLCLVSTRWDQGCGYNDNTPILSDGPCGHAYTGCVTTAMAQIMKYHNYPTNYNWNDMPNNNPSSSIANLMGDIFSHVIHSYDVNGSSGYLYDGRKNAYDAFNYFNYNSVVYHENAMSDSNSITYSLSAGNPILFAGALSDNSNIGHAWVCDGMVTHVYDCCTDVSYHMNWGWSGNENGFFSSWIFNSPIGNLHHRLEMITNIHP